MLCDRRLRICSLNGGGRAFWVEAAKTTGATDLQMRFAVCRHRGMTAAGAARLAGYGGSDENIRQTGSKTSRSPTIMNLLALAAAEAGAGDDGVVGTGEAKRILSRLARGSDPNVRIKALNSLNKLEVAERELAASRADLGDPVDSMRELIVAVPLFGPAMAAGMWFNWQRSLVDFPFLRVAAPYLAKHFPADWARWRGPEPDDVLDRAAAGPQLTPEQIAAAVSNTGKPKLNGGSYHVEQEAAHAGA